MPRDGITYLRPGVQLLHKAPGLRPKDQADFDACVGMLAAEQRAWLQEALSIAHPGHPWLAHLEASGSPARAVPDSAG